MRLARLIWRYVRPFVAWVCLAGAAIAVYAAATGSMVALIEPLFGEVLRADASELSAFGLPGDDSDSSWLGDFDLQARFREGYESLKRRFGITADQVVWFTPLLFVIVFLVRAAANFVSGYAFQHIGLGATTRMRDDLYGSMLEQSSDFFARHSSGELVSRVVNDVAVMQSAVSNRLFDLVQQSFTLIVLTLLLLSTNTRLAVICLLLAPVLLLPIVRFGKGMRRTSHRSQERMADLASLVNEGVRGHRVVKAFGMERFELGRFQRATRQHLRVNLWAQVLANLSSPVVESLAVLGVAGLLVFAGLQVRSGALSAPLFVQFLANLVIMYDPIRKLNKVNLMLQQSLAAAHRVADILDEPVSVAERPGAGILAGVGEGIEYVGVSFGYEDLPVLQDIDLVVRTGEVVALVGPSGAGKSTLVNLLLRFFDPDAGAVRVGGQDIRDVTLASLRAHIGVVTQDTVLFNDTVRANIAYGRADLPTARVEQAASAAHAAEFIEEQPRGYDTMIGEGGARLSGGQRQRLTIARALLKDAPILILDEATSHLDTESESQVQQALANLMQGRTTLVIAHRLSTVTRADRIVVLDRGRIVDQGRHDELLERGGLYRRLYDLQFRT
ncbi:MAG: ABC transporter ATP-binding protein [Thermoanaerobaculia bacterium]